MAISNIFNSPIDDIPLEDGQRVEIVIVNNTTEMPGWTLEMKGQYNSIWYRMVDG